MSEIIKFPQADESEPTYHPTKEQLLADASEKPVKKFVQLDGMAGLDGTDSYFPGDAQGHAMSGGDTYELRNTGDREMPVRILIHEDARKSDVIPLLRKLTEWLIKDWDEFMNPQVKALRQRGIDAMLQDFAEQPSRSPEDVHRVVAAVRDWSKHLNTEHSYQATTQPPDDPRQRDFDSSPDDIPF